LLVAPLQAKMGVSPVPIRGLIVPRPVFPHPVRLVPLLSARPKQTQAEIAAPLVELAAGAFAPLRVHATAWKVVAITIESEG
jgi:hypothetical protein